MFVYCYVMIRAPLTAVTSSLLALDGSRVAAQGEASYRWGEGVRVRLHAGGTLSPLAKTVRVWFGPVLAGEHETSAQIRWHATGPSGFFPRLEADLVAAQVDDELTQLSLRGSYEPPGGDLGDRLDRTLFHRIAESSIKQFLDGLAEQITSQLETRATDVIPSDVVRTEGTPVPEAS